MGREADRPPDPCDRHVPVFERLAESLEHVAVELGQLIEEQDPPMRERLLQTLGALQWRRLEMSTG